MLVWCCWLPPLKATQITDTENGVWDAEPPLFVSQHHTLLLRTRNKRMTDSRLSLSVHDTNTAQALMNKQEKGVPAACINANMSETRTYGEENGVLDRMFSLSEEYHKDAARVHE